MQAQRKSRASPKGSRAGVPESPSRRRGTQKRPLTAKGLLALPPGEYSDRTVTGLALRVRESGSRAWMLRYRAKTGRGRGPQRRLHLGDVGAPLALDVEALGLGRDFEAPASLGLEGARQVARALLGLAARGLDPLDLLEQADRARREQEIEATRRRTLGLESLGALLDRFIDHRADPTRNKKGEPVQPPIRPSTAKGWRGLAAGALAPLRSYDPATVTARMVRKWHGDTGLDRGTVVANRGLELLSVAYAWAMRTEDENGEPLLSATPCVGVRPFPERARDRVLDSRELRAVWEALEGEPYGDAIRLLLWTGARKSEALGAEWAEIDFAAKLWSVPAGRSKTGEMRRIPLSTKAQDMLEARRLAQPEGSYIFPSPVGHIGAVRSLQATLSRVQAASGVRDWTLHDLRRVVRSGLSSLGVAPAVAEFILGHLPPRMVRTYDRHEPLAEAAAALEAWAGRLERYVTGKDETGELLPFSRRAREEAP